MKDYDWRNVLHKQPDHPAPTSLAWRLDMPWHRLIGYPRYRGLPLWLQLLGIEEKVRVRLSEFRQGR